MSRDKIRLKVKFSNNSVDLQVLREFCEPLTSPAL